MWSVIATFLSDLITKLISKFIFTKTIEENTVIKSDYQLSDRTEVDTISLNDLIKKYK